MNKLMQQLIKSCKLTSELIDKQQLTSLTIKEKLQLQAHKAMCKTCTAYESQSKVLDGLIQKWFKDKSEKLSEHKKAAIIDQIKKV
ncbi:hypothetical protein [Flavobacterium sp. UMI-01]|uniref:hypothetical protein n=1 Tax=Flavobacterium sp. UMI-01 TaxID=1441053 RepID=UPI001C7CCD3B|nr:hypothetical protein [Flavobacterium sp. UMI-01]GIZ10162.1 hypothetical protein FUMI01_28880 [Flavobacterium sp. UMI-01]